MEQETIRAVREAELAAEQIEQEAARQREEILSRAKADAAEAVGHAVAGRKPQGGTRRLPKQSNRAKPCQSAALESVKKEIASLRASADAKGAEVRRLILSELI